MPYTKWADAVLDAELRPFGKINRGGFAMWRYILQRELDGSWRLFVPVPEEAWLTLAFGDAAWDADQARWTRPNRNDYEGAERMLVIMRGRGNHSLGPSSPAA